MDTLKDKITTSQTAITIASRTIAFGILILPRTITEEIKTPDGWLSILLVDLFLVLAAFIIVKLCRRFPKETFYQFNQKIIGKWMGWLLSLSMIAFFLLLGGFEARGMAEVTKVYLLPKTPLFATIIPFICMGVYLLLGGINPMVRLFEILFPLTTLVFILIMLLSLKTFEINNLRPVMGLGIMPVLKGVKVTFLSISGIEFMLILFPFMKKPQKAFQASVIGILLPAFFYVTTIIFVLGNLGIEGVTIHTWPSLALFRQFEYVGIFFERFDTFLLAVWLLQVFTTFAVCHYAAALGLAQLFGKEIHPFIYGLAPFFYLIAMSPKNINDLFHLGTFIGDLVIFFMVAVPLVLLIIAKLRGIKHVPLS